MSNALYDNGRNAFARGEIAWKATAGSDIKVLLVDNANYTPDLVNHQFLSSIPVNARAGQNNATDGGSQKSLTLLDPAAGVVDADDCLIATVPAGFTVDFVILYKWTGSEATSPLIARIDTATGLPLTTTGASVSIAWSNDANKIFKL